MRVPRALDGWRITRATWTASRPSLVDLRFLRNPTRSPFFGAVRAFSYRQACAQLTSNAIDGYLRKGVGEVPVHLWHSRCGSLCCETSAPNRRTYSPDRGSELEELALANAGGLRRRLERRELVLDTSARKYADQEHEIRPATHRDHLGGATGCDVVRETSRG